MFDTGTTAPLVVSDVMMTSVLKVLVPLPLVLGLAQAPARVVGASRQFAEVKV